MTNRMPFILLFIISVFISSVSQVLLKKSTLKKYSSKIKEYLNVTVIVAYAMFFGATLITVMAYKFIPLSIGPILESTGYIFVTILGAICLKEKISRKKLMGMGVIMLGIIVFSL